MNPSGKPDKNLVEYYSRDSGTPDNPAIYRHGILDGSQDPDLTGVIKCTSGFHDAIIYVDEIIGAAETHYDFNNGATRVKLFVKKFTNIRSEYIGSIKGGCVDCSVSGPVYGIMPSKGVHHIDGNWSDQSSAITIGTWLGLDVGRGPILVQELNSSGVKAIPPFSVSVIRKIPLGRFGIAVVWFVWGILKKLHLA